MKYITVTTGLRRLQHHAKRPQTSESAALRLIRLEEHTISLATTGDMIAGQTAYFCKEHFMNRILPTTPFPTGA